MNLKISRSGGIYMCRFGDIFIAKIRCEDYLHWVKQPILVVSDGKFNKKSDVVNVLPIADAAEQDKLLGYANIGEYGIWEKNIAVIEQIKTINQTQLLVKIGSIRGTAYAEVVKQAIKVYLCL